MNREEGTMQSVKINRQFLKADLWKEWRDYKTDQKKGVPPPQSQKPCPDNAVLVDLITLENLSIGRMPLIEAIGRRRSRRKFSEVPLTLEEISFLLWAVQGVNKEATEAFRQGMAGMMRIAAEKIGKSLRSVPSAGACHPFETYLLVCRVSELKAGLYRYLPMEHKLLFLKETEQVERDGAAYLRWASRQMSAVVFMWTAIPYRTEWQYSMVTYKMIAQESGHLCQNLYLACEAIGAGTCAIGDYDQTEADRLLGVDGEDEFAIYVAPVGKVG
jgi:SagB-type dehydrogenase family enzyme